MLHRYERHRDLNADSTAARVQLVQEAEGSAFFNQECMLGRASVASAEKLALNVSELM